MTAAIRVTMAPSHQEQRRAGPTGATSTDQGVAGLPIVCEDFDLPSFPADVRIHVRRKCLTSQPSRGGRNAIVFVHGATFSGIPAFDAPLPGGSWLDFAAAHGHDAYAIDVRGYGLSSPPDSGSRTGAPYARTEDAILDLGAAVDFVLARTGADSVDLVGWSWGTAICGGYAAKNRDKVRRLVMYAPLWILRNLPKADLPLALAPLAWLPALGPLYSANLASFRTVTFADARRRWFRGLDEPTAGALCPDDVLERWWQAAVRADPIGASQSPSVVRAPNGVAADLIEYWAAGASTYDPGSIAVPVLAILGEWDVDTPPEMARELFGRLTAAPCKRLEVLGRGTHSMLLEVNRFDLYRRVQLFLEEASFPPGELAHGLVRFDPGSP